MNDRIDTYQPPLPEHLDFDRLRDRASVRLQALAGNRWTDYNAHDPGLTLLEALCYALTDLGYRAGFTMPELLAGESDSFFGPEAALPGAPVSGEDLLRYLYALGGVAQVRVDALHAGEQQPELFYYPYGATGAIGMEDFPGAQAVPLQGIYQLAAGKWPYATNSPTENAVLPKLIKALHETRGLCTDYESTVITLAPEAIPLYLTLDIASVLTNPQDFIRELLERLAHEITRMPALQNQENKPKDIASEVWHEQANDKGYFSPGDLERLRPRPALYASDVAQWLIDQQGVEQVRRISFEADKISLLRLLSPDQIPVLAITDTVNNLKVFQQGRAVEIVNPSEIVQGINSRLAQSFTDNTLPATLSQSSTLGRGRKVGNYYSIRHDLPTLYGLTQGTEGLSAEMAARRKQLSAYLLFFEQILGGQFAQLDHGRRLFDLHQPVPGYTYAWPDLSGLPLAAEVLANTYALPNQEDQTTDRLQRLYDHLLARLGEQVYVTEPAQKLAFLQQWPALSARRGLGVDYRQAGAPFFLESRIKALLGLTENERFYLVENILLRPIPEDQSDDEGNWLTHVPRPDPFSLRVVCILPAEGGRFALRPEEKEDNNFRLFTKRVIREEVPAHIAIDWLWLNANRMENLETAWGNYKAILAGHGNALTHRIARDAVLDVLMELNRPSGSALSPRFFIGWPAPILDIKAYQQGFAEPGGRATIVLENSQIGAVYILCNRQGEMLGLEGGPTNAANNAIQVQGNGHSFEIQTAILGEEDTTFSVKVVKNIYFENQNDPIISSLPIRSGYLRRKVFIQVGISTNLTVQPEQQVIDYLGTATVAVNPVQAAVGYRLIDAQSGENRGSERPGVENTPLVLETSALKDDKNLFVAAKRELSSPPPLEQPMLKFPLQVFVRPNPDLDIQANLPAYDYGTSARITIRNSQAGVYYQLRIREIADHEFKHGEHVSESDPLIRFPDFPTIRLKRLSENAALWPMQELPAVLSTGGDLNIETGALHEDSWVEVFAYKERPAVVEVTLQKRLPLLVYPKATGIPLENLRPQMRTRERGQIRLAQVQTGVFYYLVSVEPNQPPFSEKAYAHDTTQGSARQDGIGPVRPQTGLGSKIEVDWVVGPPSNQQSFLIDTLPFSNAGTYSALVFATKAQTGLEKNIGTVTFEVTQPGRSAESRSVAFPTKPRSPRKKPKP